jgi:hypothetical protein
MRGRSPHMMRGRSPHYTTLHYTTLVMRGRSPHKQVVAITKDQTAGGEGKRDTAFVSRIPTFSSDYLFDAFFCHIGISQGSRWIENVDSDLIISPTIIISNHSTAKHSTINF